MIFLIFLKLIKIISDDNLIQGGFSRKYVSIFVHIVTFEKSEFMFIPKHELYAKDKALHKHS